MTEKKKSGRSVGDVLREAGVKPSDFAHSEATPGRRTPTKSKKVKRTAKSRSKMWHITNLLQENPEISDADIKRSIRAKYTRNDGRPESVSESVIQEARYIFACRLERGEITIKGKPAYLHNVQQGYMALSDQDRNIFLTWLHLGAPPEHVRRPTESDRAYRERTKNY
jgi:hypothetical protein